MILKPFKYSAVALLFAVSSCTYNQYTTVRGGYDDLYGGRYDEAVAVRGESSQTNYDRNSNPDYKGDYNDNAELTDQYYDENYITARNIQRNVSNNVGYNSGFVDGYHAARNDMFFNRYAGGFYPMYGYSRFNIGFSLGWGSMFSYGYSPFGWSRWNRFYDPYWDSFAWGDPFYGGYGYPYYSSYYGWGGYGYSPYMWRNYYPVIINNYYAEKGIGSRNYGPRTSGSAVSRTAAVPGSARGLTDAPSARSARSSYNSERSASTSGREGYYARPRSISSNSSARVNAATTSTRAAASTSRRSDAGNFYYSTPSTNRSSTLRSGSVRGSEGSALSSPSRSYNGSNYSAPSRSNSSYSTPSRSTTNPSRSYSAPSSTPTRSYSAPSTNYSAPSRSSAPASSGSGRSSVGSSGGRGGR